MHPFPENIRRPSVDTVWLSRCLSNGRRSSMAIEAASKDVSVIIVPCATTPRAFVRLDES